MSIVSESVPPPKTPSPELLRVREKLELVLMIRGLKAKGQRSPDLEDKLSKMVREDQVKALANQTP